MLFRGVRNVRNNNKTKGCCEKSEKDLTSTHRLLRHKVINKQLSCIDTRSKQSSGHLMLWNMCVWQTRQPVAASSSRTALRNEGQVAATDWTDRQSSDRITLRARTAGREKKGGLEVRVSKVHMVDNVHHAARSDGNKSRGGFYWQSVIHTFASLAWASSAWFKGRHFYMLSDFLRYVSSQSP